MVRVRFSQCPWFADEDHESLAKNRCRIESPSTASFIEDFHFSLMHLDPAQVCLRSSVACQYLELTPEF